jgi:hypothetical protein
MFVSKGTKGVSLARAILHALHLKPGLARVSVSVLYARRAPTIMSAPLDVGGVPPQEAVQPGELLCLVGVKGVVRVGGRRGGGGVENELQEKSLVLRGYRLIFNFFLLQEKYAKFEPHYSDPSSSSNPTHFGGPLPVAACYRFWNLGGGVSLSRQSAVST